MEINTQQMEALLHLQEQQAQVPRTRNGAQPEGFESLLSNQMTVDQVSGYQEPALTGAALYSQIMLNNSTPAATEDTDSAVLQAAFEQASGALDMWDSYASALRRPGDGASLRSAYSLLEGIDTRIAELQSNPAAGHNAEFDNIVNNLAILSATEKFKFNRGDYL